jgi:hypothetical protein
MAYKNSTFAPLYSLGRTLDRWRWIPHLRSHGRLGRGHHSFTGDPSTFAGGNESRTCGIEPRATSNRGMFCKPVCGRQVEEQLGATQGHESSGPQGRRVIIALFQIATLSVTVVAQAREECRYNMGGGFASPLSRTRDRRRSRAPPPQPSGPEGDSPPEGSGPQGGPLQEGCG